jgi:hypothetical protein
VKKPLWLVFLRVLHVIGAGLDSVVPSRAARRADAPATAAPATAAKGRLWTGGGNPDSDARKVFRLIFGALRNAAAFGWAKRSPIVTRFIAHELNNPPLAKRWQRVVSQLPLLVPDKYAAAAQEESKFEHVSSPLVSDSREQCDNSPGDPYAYLYCLYGVGQPVNSSTIVEDLYKQIESMAFPMGGPQESIVINQVGQGTVVSNPAGIDCGQTCSQVLPSGNSLALQANAAAGWAFSGWSGCTSTPDNTEAVSANTCTRLSSPRARSSARGPTATARARTPQAIRPAQ